MSEENLENARQALDAFNRRDRAAWLALRDPDCETVPMGDWPEARAIRGPEAGWEFYVGVTEAFEGGPYRYAELMAAGPDKTVGHLRRRVRGRASGVDVEFNYWAVTTYREGIVLRDEWFEDRAQALEAAGLSE